MRVAFSFLFVAILFCNLAHAEQDLFPVESAEFKTLVRHAQTLSKYADKQNCDQIQEFVDEISSFGGLSAGLLEAFAGYLEAYFMVLLWDSDLGSEFDRAYEAFNAHAVQLFEQLKSTEISSAEFELVLRIGNTWKRYDGAAVKIKRFVEVAERNPGMSLRPAEQAADQAVQAATQAAAAVVGQNAPEPDQRIEQRQPDPRRKRVSGRPAQGNDDPQTAASAAAAAAVPPIAIPDAAPPGEQSPSTPTQPEKKKPFLARVFGSNSVSPRSFMRFLVPPARPSPRSMKPAAASSALSSKSATGAF